VPLFEQAQRNVGSRGQIETIVVDRGYLDGSDVWQVQPQGVLFVVTSTAGMTVTQDAQARAKGERAKGREQVVRQSHGKRASEERLRTELVGIEALTSSDASGEPEQTQDAHRRDDTGQPINAVVVRRWNHRIPKGDGTVSLTHGPVSDPLVTVDRSDTRSVMEHGLFKEGTDPWHFGRFPKKTDAAVIVQCHCPLLLMGRSPAFRWWQAQQASTSSQPPAALVTLSTAVLGGEGTARWRQRLNGEHRDTVIVCVGEVSGLFHLAELAVLSGLRLQRLPSPLGSRQDILQRSGMSP
jgi:hypothetical protein